MSFLYPSQLPDTFIVIAIDCQCCQDIIGQEVSVVEAHNGRYLLESDKGQLWDDIGIIEWEPVNSFKSKIAENYHV